jgi:hypothetical protein
VVVDKTAANNEPPPPDAPLVHKVQYICSRLEIGADLPLVQVVSQATAILQFGASAISDTTLIGQVELCLDALLDRTSNAQAPCTPDLGELQASTHADMMARAEAAWLAMQEARKNNVVVEDAGPSVVSTLGNEESVRRWLREHCVSFPEGASLAELQALAAEERAAIEEEEAAMAQYNASMNARGQPAVVTAISTAGRNMTVLDEARAGEEEARRELIEAAEAAAALRAAPVVVGYAAADAVVGARSAVPVVVAAAVVDEDTNRPSGGIAALANTMRIS